MIYADRKNLKIPCEERILGHYGDNEVEQRIFEIGEDFPDCKYILHIAFSDGSINPVLLENGDDNTAVWNVRAEHIFTSGIAYIQLKAVSENGEIWHSPEAAVEFLHSIEGDGTGGEYTPTLLEQLEEKIDDVLDLEDNIIYYIETGDYITRPEAVELVNNSIDDLLLPLNRRLDGENAD